MAPQIAQQKRRTAGLHEFPITLPENLVVQEVTVECDLDAVNRFIFSYEINGEIRMIGDLRTPTPFILDENDVSTGVRSPLTVSPSFDQLALSGETPIILRMDVQTTARVGLSGEVSF